LRVGGPAELIFLPEDEDDLAAFWPAWTRPCRSRRSGSAPTLLVRDGGVDGVVIRLGRAFAKVEAREGDRIFAGAAVLDAGLAREAGKAGIAGLEFYRGVPGTIGGARDHERRLLRGRDQGRAGRGLRRDRAGGERLTLSNAELDFTLSQVGPRRAGRLVITGALFEGRPDDPAAVAARMDEITARREQTQPIREKTGGSTFKNPPGQSAWKLVDGAGWRGKLFTAAVGGGGGAMFSPLHANFLINTGRSDRRRPRRGRRGGARRRGRPSSASPWTGRSSASGALKLLAGRQAVQRLAPAAFGLLSAGCTLRRPTP
jgi:UDP-N-acetylmuramate dehydrogenase